MSPEVSLPKALEMSAAERGFRHDEARDSTVEWEQTVRDFLNFARDPAFGTPTVEEAAAAVPSHATDLRQDAFIALETLRRVLEVFNSNEQVPAGMAEQTDQPPRHNLRHRRGKYGTDGEQLSDEHIREIANEHQHAPSREDFDEYIGRMANFDAYSHDDDITQSAHGKGSLPEYHDEEYHSPTERFQNAVRRLCEVVCDPCTERAKVLIDTGVTTEEALAHLTDEIRTSAARLKIPDQQG
jgi:hypothetical protein